MSEVVMPRLSDSMEEGTILKWLKPDGAEVKRGEEIVEIETDKANMTYEADQSGVLEIIAAEGDTLPVGAPIATIGGGGEKSNESDSKTGNEASSETKTSEKTANGAEKKTNNGVQDKDSRPEPVRAASSAASDDSTTEGFLGDIPSMGSEDPTPTGSNGVNGSHSRALDLGHAADSAAWEPVLQGIPPQKLARTAKEFKASPLARRMAREIGLSLSQLSGSGPGGRIVKADIQAAAQSAAASATQSQSQTSDAAGTAIHAPAEPRVAAPAQTEQPAQPVPPAIVSQTPEGMSIKGDTEVQELTRLQQTVARRMAESKATAPEFVLNIEVDMDEAVKLRKRLKDLASGDSAPSFNDFIVKASALALRDFPRANGAYRDGKFELYSRVNVGIAVAGQDALVVPTIFDTDRKSLVEIGREARVIAQRVRAGAITPPELSGGTFTVSNLGMFGIKSFTAVINPPQAAILAVGAMAQRAVVREGEVTARHILDLTLSCDHRILYGADAAQFLNRIKERLEEPLLLAL